MQIDLLKSPEEPIALAEVNNFPIQTAGPHITRLCITSPRTYTMEDELETFRKKMWKDNSFMKSMALAV